MISLQSIHFGSCGMAICPSDITKMDLQFIEAWAKAVQQLSEVVIKDGPKQNTEKMENSDTENIDVLILTPHMA